MDANDIENYNPVIHMPTVYVDEKGSIVRVEATPLGNGQLSALDMMGDDPHLGATKNQWATVRQERSKRLAATDWVVAKAYETGTQVPTEWADYRQALRDITDQKNPWLVVWPEPPVTAEKPLVLNTTPPGEIPVATP